MSAIPNLLRSSLWPRAPRQRRLIDPVAFFVALVGAPLLVTAATFWVVFIPVFALVLGGPVYLALGAPTLLIMLARGHEDAATIAIAALLAVVGLCGGAIVLGELLHDNELVAFGMLYGGFGLIFGPVWGAAFAKLYSRLRREIYQHPIKL